MIKADGKYFFLNTKNTTYAFRVMETGQLEHLYYGSLIDAEDGENISEKRAFAPGNTVLYDNRHTAGGFIRRKGRFQRAYDRGNLR